MLESKNTYKRQSLDIPSIVPNAPVEIDETPEAYMTLYHFKGTDEMPGAARKPLKKNILNNTASVEQNGVNYTLNDLDNVYSSLGVSPHKLLNVAISRFSELNPKNHQRKIRTLKVSFSLEKYADKSGYKVRRRPTSTPEEEKRENNRIKNELKNARRKVKEDIQLLSKLQMTYEEVGTERSGDFYIANVFGGGGVRKGIITIEFTQSMAEYLMSSAHTKYPEELLKLDARHPTAYAIGNKLSIHFNLDNNQIAGTSQTLRVETLLNISGLPKFDDKSVKKAGWRNRIKEPFENALDQLTGGKIDLLSGWEYTGVNSRPLTDEEANFKTYDEWKEARLHFTLKDPPDHTERLKKKEQKKLKAQAKKKKNHHK